MSTNVATVQKRGQVTIPSDLREEYGIKPGDQVAFVRTDEGILITTMEAQKIQQLRQLLGEVKAIIDEKEKQRGEPYSLEELIEGLREERGRILREKYGMAEDDQGVH